MTSLLKALKIRGFRVIGPILACAALIVVGGFAALSYGGNSSSRVQDGNATPSATATDDMSATPTNSATPTDGSTATATATHSSGPTPVPYTGPNYMKVTYDTSSCHPGAVSPYPYLSLTNASPDKTLTWDITIGNPAYVLYQNPPRQILGGWSDFLAFLGPMNTSASLFVSLTGNIGHWSGNLVPCSIATPVPPPTPVTITCADGQATVSARICLETRMDAVITATVTYCDGTHDHSPELQAGLHPVGAGTAILTWVPNTTCYGTVNVSLDVNYFGDHTIVPVSFTLAPPPSSPTPTPSPTPPATPTPTSVPTDTPTP